MPPRRSTSNSSTPAAPTQAEMLNFSDLPKPFKSDLLTTTAQARANLPANRRNKTLKQILTTQREESMGLVTQGKRKGKRPLSPKSLAEYESRERERDEAVKKAGVAGAAAKTHRRKIRREQRERARAAKMEKKLENNPNANRNANATPEIEGTDEEDIEGDDRDDTVMDSAGSGLVGRNERTETTPAREDTPTEQEKEEEKLLQRKRQLPTYSTVEAPPSLRPRKKYCDVTGLIAPYTDPKTGLRYHNVEIYELIKTFGPGVDQAYLSLRGDGTQIK